MAKTITKGSREGFLLNRTSKFQAENSKKLPYYTFTKYTRGFGSFENLFIFSFNSEINPNILPSQYPLLPEGALLSEYLNPLVTEMGDYLVYEPETLYFLTTQESDRVTTQSDRRLRINPN